jgi:hypothetical protein
VLFVADAPPSRVDPTLNTWKAKVLFDNFSNETGAPHVAANRFNGLVDYWPVYPSNWAYENCTGKGPNSVDRYPIEKAAQASIDALHSHAAGRNGHGVACFGRPAFVTTLDLLVQDGWLADCQPRWPITGHCVHLEKGGKKLVVLHLPHWGTITNYGVRKSRRHFPLAFKTGLVSFYGSLILIANGSNRVHN